MIDYEVERGDKIAVVGPNGAGKSTFIRILAGMEPYQNGKVETGYNVTTGYFAQHQAEELNPANTILEEMKTAGTGAPETRLRSEEHTSELQSRGHLVCRLLLETKKG